MAEFFLCTASDSEAVYYSNSTADCSQAWRQRNAGIALPTAAGREAVHCNRNRRCTAYYHQAVRQCVAGFPLLTAPKQ